MCCTRCCRAVAVTYLCLNASDVWKYVTRWVTDFPASLDLVVNGEGDHPITTRRPKFEQPDWLARSFLAAITALVNRTGSCPDKYNVGHVLNSTTEIKWMTTEENIKLHS
jgi:hypothetical protein